MVANLRKMTSSFSDIYWHLQVVAKVTEADFDAWCINVLREGPLLKFIPPGETQQNLVLRTHKRLELVANVKVKYGEYRALLSKDVDENNQLLACDMFDRKLYIYILNIEIYKDIINIRFIIDWSIKILSILLYI